MDVWANGASLKCKHIGQKRSLQRSAIQQGILNALLEVSCWDEMLSPSHPGSLQINKCSYCLGRCSLTGLYETGPTYKSATVQMFALDGGITVYWSSFTPSVDAFFTRSCSCVCTAAFINNELQHPGEKSVNNEFTKLHWILLDLAAITF